MELIYIPSHPMAAGLSPIEPLSKVELELLTGYRRLSSDNQERILSVVQALVAVNDASESPSPQL